MAAAVDARTHARAAFSGFQVGAALETAEGEVVTGCNVENATYGLTMCAERVALLKALSEGRDAFTRIAVVADTERPHAAVRRRAASSSGSTAATSRSCWRIRPASRAGCASRISCRCRSTPGC